jgi:ADP-ribose pyrophosphatase
MKVREDRIIRSGSPEALFGVVTMKPGVSVLPLETSGDVHLVREFKYGLGAATLEVVSGAIESGETPEHAGLRELAEEVNLIASEWVDMGFINPFTTVVNSPNHMFLARGLSKVRRQTQADETIEVVTMPFAKALQAVLDGTITHGASCVLILKAAVYLERSTSR